MRFGFVADVHLGNHRLHGGPIVASLNARCLAAVEVFGAAIDRAGDLGCDAVFVLGDLFDYQRPEAQLLTAVRRRCARRKSPIWVVMGNHDMTSSTPGDHALGPLEGLVTVVERPTVQRFPGGVEVCMIPYQVAALDTPEALRELFREAWEGDRTTKGPAILGIHAGLIDDKTAPWLRSAHDAAKVEDLRQVCKEFGVRSVFAGNWHDRRRWGGPPEMFQLGALVPTGWDNPGIEGYGTLGLWTDGAMTYEEIPGPRFIMSDIDLVARDVSAAHASKAARQVFVRLTTPPELLAEGRSALEALGVIGDVRADAVEATVAARSAATAARSAATLDEALSGFVDNMVLLEGVDRAEVLRVSTDYLHGVRG